MKPALFGYRSQIDAPVSRVSWHFLLPERPDLDALDRWLAAHADIASGDLPHSPDSGTPDDWNGADQVAQRILLLARTLQQAGRGAVFDPGRLTGPATFDAGHEQWCATAWVPRIDQVFPAFTRLAVNEASQCIGRLLTEALTPELTADILRRWEVEVIPTLSRLAMQGSSTVPLLREVHRRGVPFRHLGMGAYQLGWGSRGVIVDRSTTSSDSAFGARLSQNKSASGALMRLAGLPVPRHSIVRDEAGALAAAASLGWPVVVKPADKDRGEGVHVDIRTEARLRECLHLSRAVSKNTLVEQQIPGVCHRVFIADNRLLYVVKRLPIGFYGDGARTVREIVEADARRRSELAPWNRDSALPLDALALETLERQGCGPDSVAAPDRFVALRPIESTEWGGVDEDCTDTIHPDNVDIALRGARALALRNAGVDIISTDIGVPWHVNGAAINEINFAPLLGGGEISRGRIGQYLDWIAPGDRRIPVTAVVGNARAWALGLEQQALKLREGLRCCITSHRMTLDHTGAPIARACAESVFDRTIALTLDPQVDAIVIVVQTTELLRTGAPVDRLEALRVADDDAPPSDAATGLSPADIARVRTMLAAFTRR